MLKNVAETMESRQVDYIWAERQATAEHALRQLTSWVTDLFDAVLLEKTRRGELEAGDYRDPEDAASLKWKKALDEFAEQLGKQGSDVPKRPLSDLVFPATHGKTDAQLRRLGLPLFVNAERMGELYVTLRAALDKLDVLDEQGCPKQPSEAVPEEKGE